MSLETIMTIIGLSIILFVVGLMFILLIINLFTDEESKLIAKSILRRLKKNDKSID